jgi:hypothetical protein
VNTKTSQDICERYPSNSEKNTRALMAAAAITHDRKIYPKEEKNQTGKVRWDRSEAQ